MTAVTIPRRGRTGAAALAVLALALGGSGAVGAIEPRIDSVFGRCIGDCGDDGRVTIDEIVLGVRIALGHAAPEVCELGGPGFGIYGLVTAVSNSLAGCTVLRDVSGFDRFAYALTSAYGFCPAIGAVHDAVIQRHGDGYVLTRSIVATGTPGIDDCIPNHLTGHPCLVARPAPCRALAAAEVERVREIFREITVWTAADSFCLVGVDDPCLVRTARWDDLHTSDALCAASRLDHEQSGRVTALMESLGSGPEVACDGP